MATFGFQAKAVRIFPSAPQLDDVQEHCGIAVERGPTCTHLQLSRLLAETYGHLDDVAV